MTFSFLVGYFTTLSESRLYSAEWLMNRKGSERKRPWPNRRDIPEFYLQGLRTTTISSVRVADVTAEIQTELLCALSRDLRHDEELSSILYDSATWIYFETQVMHVVGAVLDLWIIFITAFRELNHFTNETCEPNRDARRLFRHEERRILWTLKTWRRKIRLQCEEL